MFNGADLRMASFCEVDLRGADFREARANKIGFFGCDLRRAKLAGANFHQAHFYQTKMPKEDELAQAGMFGIGDVGVLAHPERVIACLAKSWGYDVSELVLRKVECAVESK